MAATWPASVAESASARNFSLNSWLKTRRLGRFNGTSAFPKFTTFDIPIPSMPTIAETSEEFLSQHCWHGGAAARIRPAQGCYNRKSDAIYLIPQEEWLIAEWPAGEPAPTRYWLSTFPEATSITTLVYLAKLRWRIEDDYEDLKQEVGLADFEGRTWQGFHHHASLCIAARTFLSAERSRLSPPTSGIASRLAQSALSGHRPWRRPAAKGRAS